MYKHSFVAVVALALTAYTLGGCGTDEGGEVSSAAGGVANVGGQAAVGGDMSATTTTPASAAGGSPTDSSTSSGGGSSNPTSSTSSVPGIPTAVSHDNCADTSGVITTLTGQYNGATISVTGATKTYQATTNWWHKYVDQTVKLDGIGYTVGNPNNVNVPQTDGAPIGYPTIFVGTYAGSTTKGSNLPKKVSDLTNVYTVYESNSLSLDHSNFNAAYDVWLTANGTPLPQTQYSPGAGGAFLMVWMFKPAQRQPRGKNAYPAHTVTGVDGTWDVWVDSSNPPCISYVSTTPRESLAYDLNNFIQDSVTNKYGVTSDMYLSIVFGGFEIWGGGDGLQLKDFCVDVK